MKNLLLETPETYYWIGFILADGHIDKSTRLIITLSNKDKVHLEKLGKYLNVKIRTDNRFSYLSKMSSKTIKELCKKFDIHSNKTENPPKMDFYGGLTDNLFNSLLVGFIDGDGNITNLHKRKDFHIRLKCHSSWLNFFKLIQKRLNIKTHPKVNNQGYSQLTWSNTEEIKQLKQFILDNDLPVLDRKWSKVDMNYVSKYITTAKRVEYIKEQLLKGKSQREIREKLGMSKAGISLLIKRKNLK